MRGQESTRGRGYVRRGLAAAVSALLIGTGMFSGTAAATTHSGGGDRNLRVMSFNIHHAQGTDAQLDLNRVAEVVRAQQPDVVGLQEVDRHWSARSDFEDQATRLAEALRMHVVFGANLDLDPPGPGQPRRQYGTAILSQHPILDWENTLLPRFGEHEQRGLLRARVELRGVPVQVYNTHLQHNDATERLEQARAIIKIIGTPRTPVVLTGDLNAPPGTPEISALTELLHDAWTGEGGYTHPSELPTARIDYVMASQDVTTQHVSVVTTTPTASDHLPVVGDFLLPHPPPPAP